MSYPRSTAVAHSVAQCNAVEAATVAECNTIGGALWRRLDRKLLPVRYLCDNPADVGDSARRVHKSPAMRVAVPVWQGRVSPVFDVAGQLMLVELVQGLETSRREYRLPDADPQQRAAELSELHVETLICGAISQALESLLTESGIKVYGRVCGNVEDVLRAFASGTLGQPRFVMPGCWGRARGRFRGGRGRARRWQEGAAE